VLILRTIHPINIQNICHLKQDTQGLWNALKQAHQDSSAEGVMFWLQMVNNDLIYHLDNMVKMFERLSSLITVNSPLTLEDIYLTSMLTSLPLDWFWCVSLMMNELRITPSKLIDALKAEHL
jgi:hypothetical protein